MGAVRCDRPRIGQQGAEAKQAQTVREMGRSTCELVRMTMLTAGSSSCICRSASAEGRSARSSGPKSSHRELRLRLPGWTTTWIDQLCEKSVNDALEIADEFKIALDDADALWCRSCARISGAEHPRNSGELGRRLFSGTRSGREEFQNSDETRDELQTRLDSHQLAAVNWIVRKRH